MLNRLKFSTWASGQEAFTSILHALGFPGALDAWLTKLSRTARRVCCAVGGFIPLASVPMATVLLVAMSNVHWQYGFSSIKLIAITPKGANFGPPGYECDSLYLVCLIALCSAGLDRCRLSVFCQRQ
jgi:putative oxidoreductase